MEILQLRVGVIAQCEHDGMVYSAALCEEVAVCQDDVHGHEVVHESFDIRRLKLPKGSEYADLHHGHGTLQ